MIAGDAMEIEIVELQPEGKRPMPLAAYRNGNTWEPGMQLRIDHMSARDLALLSLDRIDLPGWPRDAFELDADHHRATSSTKSRRSDPRDIELGARIESATIKNLLWINHLIIHFAERPLKKIDPRIRKIIGIAMAQILFLDRIPHSAAVDEAVKQARRFGRTSAAGFVNAILRRAARADAGIAQRRRQSSRICTTGSVPPAGVVRSNCRTYRHERCPADVSARQSPAADDFATGTEYLTG